MTYQESIINAKNKAVEFGLESKEYEAAVKQMQDIYLSIPKSFKYKVKNKLAQWQSKK